MIHDFFQGLLQILQFSTRDFWTLAACILILRAFWSWRLVTVKSETKFVSEKDEDEKNAKKTQA